MDTVMDRATLDAFVDGALTPEEAARVVMHLADTPEDQAYVDTLMELNALLGAAFDAPMREPVPERIRAVFRGGPAQRRLGIAPGWALPRGIRGRIPLAAGLAAAAALALALGLGLLRQPPADAPGPLQIAGPLDPETVLREALETRPSGDSLRGEGGAEVMVIATFLDRDGRPCREFEMLNPTEEARTRGIACRDPAALWTVAYAASRPVAPPRPEAEGGYVPASGAEDAALTQALDALGAGAGLTPADEGALIASGWQP